MSMSETVRAIVETGVPADRVEKVVSKALAALTTLGSKLEDLDTTLADTNARLKKIEQRLAAELSQAITEAGALRSAGFLPQ